MAITVLLWRAPATVTAVPVPGVGGVDIAPGRQIIGAVFALRH
jgi:hypothetical protein